PPPSTGWTTWSPEPIRSPGQRSPGACEGSADEALPEVPQLAGVGGAASEQQQAGGAVVVEVVRTDAPVVIEPQGELEIVTGRVGRAQLPQCDGRAGRDAARQDQRLGDARGRHGEAPAGGQVIELVDVVAAFGDGIAVAVFGLDEDPPLRCSVGGVPAVQLHLRAGGRADGYRENGSLCERSKFDEMTAEARTAWPG